MYKKKNTPGRGRNRSLGVCSEARRGRGRRRSTGYDLRAGPDAEAYFWGRDRHVDMDVEYRQRRPL